MKININDFEEILGAKLSNEAKELVKYENFSYQHVEHQERDKGVIKFINFLMQYKKESGPEYHEIREKGWQENYDSYIASGELNDLIPKFVRKKEFIRFDGGWIIPEDPDFETNFVMVLHDTIFRENFSDSSTIWEFGSGTGLNLVHLSKVLPNKPLYGCDWAMPSVKILQELNRKLNLDIQSFQFNLFQPDDKVLKSIPKDSGLFTIGTFEQLGKNYQPILDFILNSNFKRIVHVETNYELYDENELLDFLSKKYIEKRNWLQGYFSALHELERQGKIRIIRENRTFGSFFHDGYTITIWENLNV